MQIWCVSRTTSFNNLIPLGSFLCMHVAISVGLSQVFWINPSAAPKYARMAVMWIFQMWRKYSTCNMRASTSMIHDGAEDWRQQWCICFSFSFSYLFGLDREFGWGPRVVPDVNQDGHINTNHCRYRLYTVIHCLCGNSLWFFKRCFSSCWGMVTSPPWSHSSFTRSGSSPLTRSKWEGRMGRWSEEKGRHQDDILHLPPPPPPSNSHQD